MPRSPAPPDAPDRPSDRSARRDEPSSARPDGASSTRSVGESSSRRDKRAQILEAAIRVFARTGYHGSRIADIASEAGIAYGLVYHYFKNKEEILSSIFEERWGAFLDTLEHIAGQPASARAKLDQVAMVILGGHHVRPEWVKVLVLEIQRSSRFARPDQIRAVGRLFQIVARILREGQEKGELRLDVDPDVACYSFIGALEIVITGVVLDVIQPGSVEPPAGAGPGPLTAAAPGPENPPPAVEIPSPTTEPPSPDERRDGAWYEKVGRTVVDIFLNGVAKRSGGAG